jgi:hypothetical protein
MASSCIGIVRAASKTSKAADYILGFLPKDQSSQTGDNPSHKLRRTGRNVLDQDILSASAPSTQGAASASTMFAIFWTTSARHDPVNLKNNPLSQITHQLPLPRDLPESPRAPAR